jgi:hypothetical protein
MEKAGQLGAVGSYDVTLASGVVSVKIAVERDGVKADLTLALDGKPLLDALIAKLPAGVSQDVAKMIEGAVLS